MTPRSKTQSSHFAWSARDTPCFFLLAVLLQLALRAQNREPVNSRISTDKALRHFNRFRCSKAVLFVCRHRLIFPGRFQPSIFSTDELNCRVRDGNGWTLIAKDTDCSELFIQSLFRLTLNHGDPYEIRTRVAGVRGRSLRPLDQRAAFWYTITGSNRGHPD